VVKFNQKQIICAGQGMQPSPQRINL